jgi:hypothetical protein
MVLNLLSEILAGLIIGGIISYTGYKIWKKQFFYQKRLEVYAEFLPYLFKLISYIERGFETKMNIEMKNIVREEIDLYTIPLAQKMGVYFDESYLTEVLQLIDLYKDIDSELNKLTEEELEEYINQRFISIYNLRDRVLSKKDRLPYYDDSEFITPRRKYLKKLYMQYKKQDT